MPITIKDIARIAGVSHTTVSRALRHNPAIPPETTARICAIAEEQGYLVSAAARSLKTSRSQTIGIILNQMDDPYFARVLEGIESSVQPLGYSLFLTVSQHKVERERKAVRSMLEHRVDGVILCAPPFRMEHSRRLEDYGLPLVVVNNQGADPYRYAVDHNDDLGGREVARYLIGLGHKRIAYLGNADGGQTNLSRQGGFLAELEAAHLPLDGGLMYDAPSGRPEGGLAGAEHFLALAERPTAVACFNDMMAVGLMRGLQAAGLQIPQDCAVVGFDNVELSAYLNPPLTTYDQPRLELGQQAADLMLRLLEGKQTELPVEPQHIVLNGRLLARSST